MSGRPTRPTPTPVPPSHGPTASLGAGSQTGAGAGSGYLDLLRGHRSYRWLWAAQVVSLLGDWFDMVAVNGLLWELTRSGTALGVVTLCRFLPTFFAGPVAGVVVDRVSRRWVMIASDLSRAVVVLGFLLVRRPDQVWILYTVTVVQFSLASFFEPARSAALPNLVSARELVAANALGSITWSVMLTVGAAAGGAVAETLGFRTAFVIDSATFVASALCVAAIRFPAFRPAPREGGWLQATGVPDLLQGIAYVRAHPGLLATLLVKPAWSLSMGGFILLLNIYGGSIFRVGTTAASGIALFFAVRGVGTAVGPIVARWAGGETQKAMRRAVAVSFFVAGAFYFMLAWAPNLSLALLAVLLAHTGGSVIWVFSTVLLQMGAEDGYRGRVFATELALQTLGLSASTYLTGHAMDAWGLSPRLLTAALGALCFLPGVCWAAALARHARRPVPAGDLAADALPEGEPG